MQAAPPGAGADNQPPAILSASTSVDGSAITLIYDEDLNPAQVPAANRFTLTGTSATVASVAISSNRVTLTLSGIVEADQTVALSYAVPVLGYTRDLAGNAAAALSGYEVSNGSTLDVTAPVLLTASLNTAGDALTLAYDETLDDSSTPATSAYTLAGTTATVASVVVAGNTVTLALTGFVQGTDAVTISYAVPGSGKVQDLATNAAAALSSHAVTNNSTYTLVAPSHLATVVDTHTSGAVDTPDYSAWTTIAGDTIWALCTNRGAATAATCAAPSSQGWTEVPELRNSAVGFSIYVFWKRVGEAGQTEDTTPTFTWSATGNVNSVRLLHVRNCKTTGNPYTITPVKTVTASSTTQTSSVVGTTPISASLTYWILFGIDDNTFNANTRGTLVVSENLSTIAALAVVYEQGVNSHTTTVSLTESTNGADAAHFCTLVLDGAPAVVEPNYALTTLSANGYGSDTTNSSAWPMSAMFSDPTPRSGYYWRYAVWYDRTPPTAASRLALMSQRRLAASDVSDPASWEAPTIVFAPAGLNESSSAGDAHLSASGCVDLSGRVHLFWNAHWQEHQYAYWCGTGPGDITITLATTKGGTTGNALPAGLPADCSYPEIFRLSDGICLAARLGVGGAGKYGIWEHNNTANTWAVVSEDVIVPADGSPYMSHVHVNPATDVAHFAWVLAENQYTASYRDVYYFCCSRSGGPGGTWTYKALASGSAVSLPIDSSATYRALSTGLNRGLWPNPGITSTTADVPIISVHYAKDSATDRTGGDNRYAITRSGGAWVRNLMHEVHPTWNLIDGNGSLTDPNAVNNEYLQASQAKLHWQPSSGKVHAVYKSNYQLGSAGMPVFMITTSSAAPWDTWTTPRILIDSPVGDAYPNHDTESWKAFEHFAMLVTLCDLGTNWPGGAISSVYAADVVALPPP